MNGGTGWLTKPLMFLSSYAPLLLILATRFEEGWLRISCATLAVLGTLGLLALMRLQHERPGQQARHTLTIVRQADLGASSYLLGYLLPFLTISRPSLTDLAAYVGFFAVAYVVTTGAGIIQVNPTLFLLGYRVDSITDEQGSQRHLLSKTKETIAAATTVWTSRMTNDVLLFERVVDTTNQ